MAVALWRATAVNLPMHAKSVITRHSILRPNLGVDHLVGRRGDETANYGRAPAA